MIDYRELKSNAEDALAELGCGVTVGQGNCCVVGYQCGACNRAEKQARAVLAMIAENERLAGECEGCPMSVAEELRIERDQLRAEVEEMCKDADRWKWLEGSADSATWEHIGYQAHMNRHIHVDAAMSKGPKSDG